MSFEVGWSWALASLHTWSPGSARNSVLLLSAAPGLHPHLGSHPGEHPAASRGTGGITRPALPGLGAAGVREPLGQLALVPPCPLLLLLIISQGQGKTRKINILQVNSFESPRAGVGCLPCPRCPLG